MFDAKIETLLEVISAGSYTRAAQRLSLTQPAVSHHMRQLEQEFGIHIFYKDKKELRLTPEGEILVKYARRALAVYRNARQAIEDSRICMSHIGVGITHTVGESCVPQVLAEYCNQTPGVHINIVTDTIKNLYDMLDNFEIDLAITDGKVSNPSLNSVMIDTDYLVCIMSNNNPLAKHSMITLNELRRERLILRLPTSATRMLFEATLESHNESIDDFNVILEVDNVTTIKDLVQKDFGVSILAKSVCLREVRKKKLTIVPIENLSMARETNIVYHKSFAHTEVLQDITQLYHDTKKHYLV